MVKLPSRMYLGGLSTIGFLAMQLALAGIAIGVVLAARGFLNPVWAALIHVSSELLFLLNSARLLPSFAAETELAGTTLSTRAAKGAA